MNTYKASNVPLNDFIKFLEHMGAKKIRTTGGHYIFAHRDLKRPIPIQTHIDPVPKFIVQNSLITLLSPILSFVSSPLYFKS